jgi:hypothetical protein
MLKHQGTSLMAHDPEQSPLWPADSTAVTTHINLLQSIITRLAGNSVACKTWCLTLVTGLLSLAGATHVPAIVTFALVPVVVFGFMDTMYLSQERAYRQLYARTVAAIRGGSYARTSAFEVDAPVPLCTYFSAAASWSILPVYGGLIIAYAIVASTGWLYVITAAGKAP